MKTVNELNADILKITMKIKELYPELSNYLNEMPVKISGDASEGINIKDLKYYNDSLSELLKKYSMNHKSGKPSGMEVKKRNKKQYTGLYPSSEDIYNKFHEETELNPEDISQKKTANEKVEFINEKNFDTDKTGSDLDVPGSELDDQQENIGSEDEENNYYSLGGDNHNDLEEDKGE